jgi:hypothetical protein
MSNCQKCKPCHHECSHNCGCCRNRYYMENPNRLSSMLTQINKCSTKYISHPVAENEEEARYAKYLYNGSFHKGLQHNLRDGRLENADDYKLMVKCIVEHDQDVMNNIPMAKNTTGKLVNPLASYSTIMVGMPQNLLYLPKAPTLSSNQGAAEMVELYAHALSRDIPFINYDKDILIQSLLGTDLLNRPNILKHLSTENPFNSKSIFRSNYAGDLIGPPISQFLLLDIIAGALVQHQKYHVPPSQQDAGEARVEWGVDLEETIRIQNVNLDQLPPQIPPLKFNAKYLYSGRALAEAVHNDAVYQFFYQASLILNSLGASGNPGFPSFKTTGSFVTNSGFGNLLCSIAEVSAAALKNGWYWKWLHSRKLRPECFGLWIHDVKSGLVQNRGNFDISNVVLDNPILKKVYQSNNLVKPGSNSYTLSQAYREGGPLHPAYISGHAIISGACITIIKCFYNGDQKWLTIPGVISGKLSGLVNSIVQSDATGDNLTSYSEKDMNEITINSELDKLASNIAFGRNWAGIHYRTDATEGIQLGEKVAIHFMENLLSTMVENFPDGQPPSIKITLVSGEKVIIKPSLCQK